VKSFTFLVSFGLHSSLGKKAAVVSVIFSLNETEAFNEEQGLQL
jgi:hypothetical protein